LQVGSGGSKGGGGPGGGEWGNLSAFRHGSAGHGSGEEQEIKGVR